MWHDRRDARLADSQSLLLGRRRHRRRAGGRAGGRPHHFVCVGAQQVFDEWLVAVPVHHRDLREGRAEVRTSSIAELSSCQYRALAGLLSRRQEAEGRAVATVHV